MLLDSRAGVWPEQQPLEHGTQARGLHCPVLVLKTRPGLVLCVLRALTYVQLLVTFAEAIRL